MEKALGIDIGGTKIFYAIIDKNGLIISEIKKTSTPKSADEIYNTLKDIISGFENEVDFVALSTAGAVNNENSKVIGSTGNLPKGYREIDFSSLSKKKVFLENDANAAAWAEYKIGASKGYQNSIMLTFGTGVGGGIIVNGKLLKGKSGAAGEVHFIMSRTPKRACTCGNYDCFEAYASGNGLKKTAIELTKEENITTYDIVQRAKDGDKKMIEALEIWQNDIKLGILSLNNIFDSDCFILSGSMEQFLNSQEIEDFVNEHTLTQKTKVYHAKTGNFAGMIGAALLGFEKI